MDFYSYILLSLKLNSKYVNLSQVQGTCMFEKAEKDQKLSL